MTNFSGSVFLLLIAGLETTTNLLGNAAVVLAEHPRSRHRLVADPTQIAPAVEELLRYDSPVQGLSRILTHDVTLHGTTMSRGESVLLLFGSANRDERVFPRSRRIQYRPQTRAPGGVWPRGPFLPRRGAGADGSSNRIAGLPGASARLGRRCRFRHAAALGPHPRLSVAADHLAGKVDTASTPSDGQPR